MKARTDVLAVGSKKQHESINAVRLLKMTMLPMAVNNWFSIHIG